MAGAGGGAGPRANTDDPRGDADEASRWSPARPARLQGAARLGWSAIVGAGVVVALVVGVLTLVDQVRPAPTAVPLPTTPNISVDVSTAAGGQQLASFLSGHSNEAVNLDVRCFEADVEGASPCFTERSGIDLTSQPSDGDYAWMWLFTDQPCFGRGDEPRDFDACEGEVLLWIDTRTDRTTASIGNIQGAGSVAVKGSWVVKGPFGVAFFGPSVEGYELTPAG